jgi:inner membrane protein
MSSVVWLVIGIVLILSEFILPGLVVIFLGISALLISPLVYSEIITDPVIQTVAWLIVSVILILLFREQFAAKFPSLERKTYGKDSDEITGKSAEVMERITATEAGRIRINETTWYAKADQLIEPGEWVTVTSRDNLLLHVRPANAEEKKSIAESKNKITDPFSVKPDSSLYTRPDKK